jgi:Do/DeqQ family serine protease
MKNIKKGLFTLLIALTGGFIALWAYTRYFDKPTYVKVQNEQAMRYASLSAGPAGESPDLTFAAENSVHAVVHIMVTQKGQYYSGNPFFDYFFGDRGQRQDAPIRQGSGSGVIISPDGYIVTNNHVIDDADEISVTLNDKRKFEAKLIGKDPSTDLALLKIDSNDLPTLRFGNSDNLKLGEWVLAVGNPFNLTSTVTAGIVSAKSRNIGINPDQMSIEAFIQTDAAVNPGNSGGALVNTQGELVGINTAIASMTGSYTGYSFAIPASIVQKVVADLKEYGQVQRALLGVSIQEVNADVAKKNNLDKIEGVFVASVTPEGAAQKAGIQANDIILSINGVNVNSPSELQEQVGKHRPGDNISVEIKRDGKRKQYNVTLRNKHGDTQIVRKGDDDVIFGAKFVEISDREKQQLGIRYGVKIEDIGKGKFKDAGISKGFIITQVNKKPVTGVNDLYSIVSESKGGILVEGIYPNGQVAYYVFGVE